MLVSSPVLLSCTCTSAIGLPRLALPGDVTVTSGSFGIEAETGTAYSVLSVGLSESLMSSAAFAAGIDPQSMRLEPVLHARDPELQRIGWAVKSTLDDSGPLSDARARTFAVEIARRIVRRYARGAAQTSHAFSAAQMRRLRFHIDENIDKRLGIATLAQFAGVCPTSFKSLFHNAAGVPAHRYVVERRVAYAMSLMKSSVTPLSEIALQAGFFDQSHMTRCMRSVLALTPTAVRQAL